MNLTIPAIHLKNLLKSVSPAIASRTPKPALSCVLLTAKCGQLFASATDLEITIAGGVETSTLDAEGACLVPCDKLAAIANEAEGEVRLELADGQLHVSGDGYKYRINTYSVADLPPMPEVKGDAVEIDGAELRKCLTRTLYATAQEASRYAIQGVLLDGGNGAVATDGHRLAMHGKPDKGILLPSKTARVLLRALGDEPVKMYQSGNTVTFVLGQLQINSNLLEGTFPPYKDVIPRNPEHTVTVNRLALADACWRAGIMTSPESKGLRFHIDGEVLTISGRAADIGESTIKLDCDSACNNFDIGLNPQYVVQALSAIDDETVTLDLWAANKPMVVRASDYVAVIMPVNLE